MAQGEQLPNVRPTSTGHAIEVRLCAEDEFFHPQAGTVHVFLPPPLGEVRGGGALRFDHALFEGLEVPPYYDSMLGKLISHAPTRELAIDQLASALDRLSLLGLATNRRFLAACLRHPVFRKGDALIPFLAGHGDAIREQLVSEERPLVPVVMAGLGLPANPASRGCGESLAVPFTRPLKARHRGTDMDVPALGSGENSVPFRSVPVGPHRHHACVGAVDLFIDDISFEPRGGAGGAASANELRAPFNGKVIAIHAQAGTAVSKGDPLVILESMKLEHALAAQRDGTVRTVHIEAGQQAATSQVLVTLESLE